jgi:hypothetical protein
MSQELFRTRCKQGTLIITDEYIRIELGSLQQSTLYRSMLTGIDSQMGVPSLFGLGGGTNLVFHGQGAEILHADLVNPKVAKEIVGMLQHPQNR